MFDFVRLPNPIERLEFDWVRLVFCSVLFDWIGREIACSTFLTENLSSENVFDILPHAKSFEDDELVARCWESKLWMSALKKR